tara:strand:- start:193 stop:582 length:390 start_codon:yes stop_codon:yes gene_type:complete
MHPLDALNPKISDEELVISYNCEITNLVTDNHTVSDVIRNDRIESHKWFTDLLLLIFEGYEEPLAYWDLAPKIVKELREEVKRLQIYERIVLCIALHQQLPDGLHVDEELMLRAREHLRKNGEWEGEEE